MPGNSISIKFGENRVSLEIGELIASGGMGSVFRGKILGPGQYAKPVAIKQIKPQFSNDSEYRERFFREAKLGASLSHPNIAQTILYGEDSSGALYLVMELIDWPTLRSIMDRHIDEGNFFPIDAVRRLLFEIADTLAALHIDQKQAGQKLGIIHGDISPENILVSPNLRIKILDFGVSHPSKHSSSDRQPGKIEYTAPEVLAGNIPSASADIYSLGVLTFEMLCGYRPFERASSQIQVRKASWPNDREFPGDLKILVDSMLANEPKQRLESAEKITEAISAPASQFTSAGQTNTVADVRKGNWQARQIPIRSILLICLGLLLATGVTLFFFTERSRLTHPPAPPSLMLHAGTQWIDLGPGTDTESLTEFQLEIGKRLHPSACHDACEGSLGTLALLLGKKELSDDNFLKMGISPNLFAASIKGLSRALNEDPYYLKSACGKSITCSAVLGSAPWLDSMSGQIQNTLFQDGTASFSEFRTIATKLDAGGYEKKRVEDALNLISQNQLEVSPASKRLNSKLYSVSAIAGVDLIEADFTESGMLSSCQQIGDEFFAKKLDPLGEAKISRGENFEPKLSAIILPTGHLLNVVNSRKGELIFGWNLPEPPLTSAVFSRGICFYSREGSALKAVLHWTPKISDNQKVGN